MTTNEIEIAEVSRPHPEERTVDYKAFRAKELLRPALGETGWHWGVDPYQGCEFGCVACPARASAPDAAEHAAFETHIGVKSNAVELLVKELDSDEHAHSLLVFGGEADAYQPAEEHFRVTRHLLQALARFQGHHIRIETRASLVARDVDVLRKLGERHRVSVAMMLPSLDDSVCRVMEPYAPSPMRRLSAMRALAQGGVEVGLIVSPVLLGLDEDELGLRNLLERAKEAGASFAGMRPLQLSVKRREALFDHASALHPGDAMRFRRIWGVKAHTPDAFEAVLHAFEGHCQSLGLSPLERTLERPPPAPAKPSQLPLFS